MGSIIISQINKFFSKNIRKILFKVKNTSFLAGYFYFSGFIKIYHGFKDKHIRVLVWENNE
jgi:hypothetical protein